MTAELDPAGYDLLRQLEESGALTSTGLTLTDPNMSLNRLYAIGNLLGRMHMSVRFAVGDWLLFIEQTRPMEWSQLETVLGLSERTCKDYMRVSGRVPKSVRRPKVAWSQHRAVAALSVADTQGSTHPDLKAQREWLKKVEDERMSHHALRDALRNGTPEIIQKSCRCCGRDF